MKALHKNLVGKKDPPEVRAVLKATPLKIENPAYWNATSMLNEEFPWNEAIRFAERVGILAQHLSETRHLSVNEIAAQAISLADDRDIKNIDPESGISVFAFAIDTLAEVSTVGKYLKDWCRAESPELGPVFDTMELTKAVEDFPQLISRVDYASEDDALENGETLDVDDVMPKDLSDLLLKFTPGAFSSKESFRLFLEDEVTFDEEVKKAFKADGENRNRLLESFLWNKHILCLYLHAEVKDGVSECLKEDMRRYLAQPRDTLGGVPTTKGRWTLTLSSEDYPLREDATISKDPVWIGYRDPTCGS